ncbi:MAG TPA: aspartate-semialdehyde dehydrogenase [Vicinamibacterales bacterium]|jgi:aspartate-semialdehyde dehydrogenase
MIDVGILGATGVVGQQFIAQLADHPWFKVAWLGASERSAGKRYGEATAWRLPTALPPAIACLPVELAKPGAAPRLLFSALDAAAATDIERACAAAGHLVVSNARAFRMEADVPLLVPEINADHLTVADRQAESRGWRGRLVTNPNCSTVVLTMALAPLKRYGIRQVIVTTMQAISGAGYPGVASWDILGNVIPFIDGEEDKIETETRKILGTMTEGGIEFHDAAISAQTTRVPVLHGHTESISVALAERPTLDAIIESWTSFRGRPQELGLPSAPPQPVLYLDEANRPQPLLDASRGGGMTVTVGRLRPCSVLDFKFVALGHNTIRGAAGAAVLNAELMHHEGLI